MKSVSRITLAAIFAAACFSGAMAFAGKEPGTVKKERPAKAEHQRQPVELKDFTITGQMLSETRVNKKDNKEITHYYVQEADGTKVLIGAMHAKAHKGEAAAPAINPADYLNKQVTVVGKGVEKDSKKGKMIFLHEVGSITEAAADAPKAE